MPKNIIDYSKGVIYEIVCRDINIPNKYAGSTCNFKGRKSGHKRSCNNKNSSKYNYSTTFISLSEITVAGIIGRCCKFVNIRVKINMNYI